MRPMDDGPKGSAAHQKSVHDYGPGSKGVPKGTKSDIFGSPASSSNPPFDKRLNSSNPWFPGKAQRGSMVQNKDYVTSLGAGYPLKLQFLYNPMSITYDYVFNMEVNAPKALTPAQAATPMNGFMGGTTVGFALLFDRSYDVMDGTQPKGVEVDAAAFQNMVGMPGGQGFLSLIPLDVYFSAAVDVTKLVDVGGKWPEPVSTLHFHGYVSSASIAYTHFSELMVPTRCVITIGMTQIITQSVIDQHWSTADAAKPTTPAKPSKPKGLAAVPRPGTAGYGL